MFIYIFKKWYSIIPNRHDTAGIWQYEKLYIYIYILQKKIQIPLMHLDIHMLFLYVIYNLESWVKEEISA